MLTKEMIRPVTGRVLSSGGGPAPGPGSGEPNSIAISASIEAVHMAGTLLFNYIAPVSCIFHEGLTGTVGTIIDSTILEPTVIGVKAGGGIVGTISFDPAEPSVPVIESEQFGLMMGEVLTLEVVSGGNTYETVAITIIGETL